MSKKIVKKKLTGNAGPLQSLGLTEMQMLKKALETKPPKRKKQT